jgi:hypothetical protein
MALRSLEMSTSLTQMDESDKPRAFHSLNSKTPLSPAVQGSQVVEHPSSLHLVIDLLEKRQRSLESPICLSPMPQTHRSQTYIVLDLC